MPHGMAGEKYLIKKPMKIRELLECESNKEQLISRTIYKTCPHNGILFFFLLYFLLFTKQMQILIYDVNLIYKLTFNKSDGIVDYPDLSKYKCY